MRTIQRGLAGAESIFDLIDQPAEVDRGRKNLSRVQGHIILNDVSFHYPLHDKYVLKNISLQAKAGETVALVGRSGSGKTSLVSLLPRFYDINSGQISIDGVDLFDITLQSLRQQFAVVSQQVTLFNETIAKKYILCKAW